MRRIAGVEGGGERAGDLLDRVEVDAAVAVDDDPERRAGPALDGDVVDGEAERRDDGLQLLVDRVGTVGHGTHLPLRRSVPAAAAPPGSSQQTAWALGPRWPAPKGHHSRSSNDPQNTINSQRMRTREGYQTTPEKPRPVHRVTVTRSVPSRPMPSPFVELEVAGRTVKVTNPDKVFFPARGETKLDLAQYFVAVGEGALRGVRERPTVLKRYPNGAPASRSSRSGSPRAGPSGSRRSPSRSRAAGSADELCPVDVAHLVWAANLGCLDLNPWAVRRADVDHPDELRVDLDPQPGVPYSEVQAVAATIHEVLEEHDLVGLPEDVGLPRHPRERAHRAALGLPRDAPRRARAGARGRAAHAGARDLEVVEGGARATPSSSTTTRTPATGPSRRRTRCAANAEGRVSCPLTWTEIMEADPSDLTIATVPARFADGRRPVGRDRRRAVLAAAAARPRGARRARRPRRRGVAAELPQGRRRAQASRAEPGEETQSRRRTARRRRPSRRAEPGEETQSRRRTARRRRPSRRASRAKNEKAEGE